MVARAAGGAGPLLLASCQWDPHGLARRLPSRRVGGWPCVPLLPWRVQCPAHVCSALAAGQGGRGRCPFSPPPPASPFRRAPLVRVADCPVWVSLALACWYAIPRGLCVPRARSGCPSSARRVPVDCVGALALPRCAPPPPLVGVTPALCAVPVQGAGRAVPGDPCPSAFPAQVPCSACLVCVGEGGPVPASPWLALGRTPSPWWAHVAGAALVAFSDVWGWALPLLRPSVLGAGGSGLLPFFSSGAGGAGVVACHRPHSACSCELALGAVRAARGRPGVAPPASVRSARGGTLSLPRPPILAAGGRGPLPVFRGRGGCGRGDPSPTAQRTL